MAADLHDHPRLTLVSGVVRAACSADEVASTEEGYGIVVSEELRAFYMDVNGAEIVSMVGLADYLDLLLDARPARVARRVPGGARVDRRALPERSGAVTGSVDGEPSRRSPRRPARGSEKKSSGLMIAPGPPLARSG